MTGDKDHVFRNTMMQTRRFTAEMSRRRLLQLGGAGMALAATGGPVFGQDTHGPGWYTDDALTGDITIYTFSGQRWGLPTTGVLPLFNERFPNVNVTITDVPIAEGMTKLMLLASSGSSDLDALLIDPGQLQGVFNVGAAEVLNPYLEADRGWYDDYIGDVAPTIINNYRIPQNADGVHAALPFDGNAHILWYRKDLFDEAGLAVPKNWDETIATAKALNKPAEDQYGFICWARRGLYSALCFQQVFFTFGGRYFDAQEEGGWNPQINNDKGKESLEILKALMEYAHPVTMNAVDDEVQTALANGTAVFAPFAAATPVLNDPAFTEFYEVFDSDQCPRTTEPGGDISVLAGFGMYVNARSESKQAAFEFIKHLCSANYTDTRIGEAFVTNFGQPVRQSLLSEYTTIRPHFGALGTAFTKELVDVIPKMPEGVGLLEIVGAEVTAFLVGEKSAEAALADAEANMRDLLTDGGYYP